MSLVDSNAVFESRALAIGLSQETVNALALRGWVTHATFAFLVATNHGTGDDQPFIDGVLIPILGREDHVDAPKIRRLFYESHTLTAADLRRKVDANEQEAPRKLPPPEIAQRIEALQTRVSPLIIQNVLEPSHQLINAVVQTVEDGRIRYIEWTKCTLRGQEVNNVREDAELRVWKTDANGTIKAVNKDPEMQANLSTSTMPSVDGGWHTRWPKLCRLRCMSSSSTSSSLNSRRTHWRGSPQSLLPSWLLQTGSFMCDWPS